MHYKLNFILDSKANDLEVAILKGLPIWRFSGVSFKHNNIKTRLSAICKSLNLRLPAKTLYISFQSTLSYSEYLRMEFYIIWILAFLLKKTTASPRFFPKSKLQIDLSASVSMANQSYSFYQAILILNNPKPALGSLRSSLFQNLIRKLILSRSNILILGPIGFGKTFSVMHVLSQVSQSYIMHIDALCGLHKFKSLIAQVAEPKQAIFHLDELGSFSQEKLALVKLITDKTLTKNATVLATANPCKCGNYLNQAQSCRCSQNSVRAYYKKLSPALLDRFDVILYYEQDIELKLKEFAEILKDPGLACVSKKQFSSQLESNLLEYVYTHNLSQRKRAQLRHLTQVFCHKSGSTKQGLELAKLCQQFYLQQINV